MASNKNVVVLAPNGRRQNVKVTPNTTILQILEEVCKKQGYKPDEYDIKHHNHVLDTSSIIRFSGLPNNAQLEMCIAQRTREESPITLGIQLENGSRLTGNFIASDSVWQVLMKLCPEESHPAKNPVVIYMRQEIYGVQTLQNTSLKSLGLMGGRAMLRLIHRRPEELKTQANVSALLPSKPVEEKPYRRKLQSVDTPAEYYSSEEKSSSFSNDFKQPKTEKAKGEDLPKSPPQSPTKQTGNFVTDFLKREKNKKPESTPRNSKAEESMEVDLVDEKIIKQGHKVKIEVDTYAEVDEVVFLGERNALAFSLEMAQAVPHEDLPDEFFELTIQDARKLFHDLKTKREELENGPLQTEAYRHLEQSKKVLRQISQYKKSVIRVQFPDRNVLQGTFKPLETVEHVMQFVKEYLQDPNLMFHLYTTPPKCVLDPTKTLVESECVPSAVVHFGVDKPVDDSYVYLREGLSSKFTSPSIASIAASKYSDL